MIRVRKRFWVTFLVLAAFALGAWSGSRFERKLRRPRDAPRIENILENQDPLRLLAV